MKAQSYRFGKHQFTPAEAKAWLKAHNIDYISFEPASDTAKQETIANIAKELARNIV